MSTFWSTDLRNPLVCAITNIVYQHRKTNVIFHHILSLNTLQLMNIKRCLYVIVVIILIKLEVVGPNNNSILCFCSARAREVRRCCWKRFVLIVLSYLPPDKCCWIAFNNRHISFEWKKRCCFYFSVSYLYNLFTQLVSKQTYYSVAHERDKISWRVWTTLFFCDIK